MTPMYFITLFLVVLTLAASGYNSWRYLRAYKRRQSDTCGIVALISVGMFIVGTFYGLVWYIQLAGGIAPMWFRNVWRTTSLVWLATMAVLQTVILLMPNKAVK